MLNLFYDAIIKKRHELIVKEENIMAVLSILDTIKRESKLMFMTNIEMGNCGWGGEYSDYWYIFFTISIKKWKKLIDELKNNNYRIILDSDERLYVTKIEA